MSEPLMLKDLKPAPYNPREISPSALGGLRYSLSQFGDISGIVWNRRSGHLVCGHQRLKALRQEYGDGLSMEDHTIITPKGERFPVREVDWEDTQERLANLAANNPLIAGLFTPSASTMIEELKDVAPIQMEALQLGELLEQTITLDRSDDDYRAGSSPWERQGGAAAEGVIFACGAIHCRISNASYQRFLSACPTQHVDTWVEQRLDDICNC